MPYTSVKLNQIVSTKHVVILRWNSPIKQPHKCFLYGRSEAFKCKQGFWIVLLTFMWPRHWSHFLSSLVDVMVEYRPTIFCQTPYSTLKIYFLYTEMIQLCVCVFILRMMHDEVSDTENIRKNLAIERMIVEGCDILLDTSQTFVRQGETHSSFQSHEWSGGVFDCRTLPLQMNYYPNTSWSEFLPVCFSLFYITSAIFNKLIQNNSLVCLLVLFDCFIYLNY